MSQDPTPRQPTGPPTAPLARPPAGPFAAAPTGAGPGRAAQSGPAHAATSEPAARRARRHEADPAKAPGKAGRNLKAAIGVGVALAVAVVGSLLVAKVLFVPILVLAVLVGAWEMREAVAHARISVPIVPVLLGCVTMLLAAYRSGPEALVMTFALTCVGLVIWRTADGLDGAARDIAGGMLVVFYPCFLGGFASLMLAEPDHGHLRIIFFVAVTVFSDIGGYAVGVLVGKHPMAPSLSPKKSWEGFVGSLATSGLVGAVCMVWFFGGRWWQGLLTGLLAAATATVGDLVESSIKRDLGIKDMSNLLPGHGGVMDRLDSLVLCAPVVWALLLVFVPV